MHFGKIIHEFGKILHGEKTSRVYLCKSEREERLNKK